MLEVYDAELIKADIIDIEAAFSRLLIPEDEIINNLIHSIDRGNRIDNTRFEDRFGTVLYLSELSTGCKAAICAYAYPDSIIDLQECGLNARDAIFNYCENGKILLHDFGVTVVDMKIRQSKIVYAGEQFSLEEFNREVL